MLGKIELFEKMLRGEINNKNYRKFRLSKSGFYKVYSRVLFFQKVTDPIRFMVVNLSGREFQAVRNTELKEEIESKSIGKSFPHSVEKQPKEVD